jgi:hypothetical protein
MHDTAGATEAPHGEKMLTVLLKFWTNNIAADGLILPRHCQDRGVMYLQANAAHGIEAVPYAPPHPLDRHFSSLSEIQPALEDLFVANDVTVHPARLVRKLYGDRVEA